MSYPSKLFCAITISFILFTVASCKKDPIEPEYEQFGNCEYNMSNYTVVFPGAYSEDGMIPMTMNNYWKYADSTWDENGNLTQVDELIMQASEAGVLNQEAWWRTNFYPLRFFNQSEKGISDLQYDFGGCNFKADVYPIFSQDTLVTSISIYGDLMTQLVAYKVSTFETPAGNFNDCIFYDKTTYDQTVLKPGVGILEWKTGFEDGSLAGRKFTLTEYYLE